jgi:plastocyanin
MEFFSGPRAYEFRKVSEINQSKPNKPKQNMSIPRLFTVAAVSAGLAFSVAAQGKEKEKEESINSSDVPAAVQKSAEAEAKGGKIVRWEKEGADYEAVIEKGGKEWGYKFDANGKMLGKHNEAAEKH